MILFTSISSFFETLAEKHILIKHKESNKVRFIEFEFKDEISSFVKKVDFNNFFIGLLKPSIIIRKTESGYHRGFFEIGFYILKKAKQNDKADETLIQEVAQSIAEDIRQKLIHLAYQRNGSIKIDDSNIHPDFTEFKIDLLSGQAENTAGAWCEFKMYENIECNYNENRWSL